MSQLVQYTPSNFPHGFVQTLTGNSGGPVAPTAGNIDLLGDGTYITVVGNPSASTLTIELIGGGSFATSFPTDSGTAVPLVGVLNIFGGISGRDINTSGSGNTIHVNLNNAITLGDLSALAANAGAVTAVTGDVIITAGDLTLPNTNAAGNQGIIKFGGNRFISNYGTGNTFVGAASGNTSLTVGSAVSNTGVGTNALQSLTSGTGNTVFGQNAAPLITSGTYNTGVGGGIFLSLTTGSDNNAYGASALQSIVSAEFNNCMGNGVLANLTSGNYNCVFGDSGGFNYTGAETANILFNSRGVLGENNVLRIGAATGTGTQQLAKAFISGINGVTASNAVMVTINSSTDQLGVAAIPTGTVTSITAGTGLTGGTITTTGTIALSVPVSIANGGTNATSMATTDGVVYFDGTRLVTTAVGTATYVLTSNGAGNAPTFQTIPASGITTINGDTGSVTGSTVSIKGLSTAGSSVSFAGSGTAMTLNTTDSLSNTIIGKGAGNASVSGSVNTALGFAALHGLTSGTDNLALGETSLNLVTSGAGNVGAGSYALGQLLTGTGNVCIGTAAGYGYTSSETGNIVIGASNAGIGTTGESNVLRIGGGTGTGNGQINASYISGISGITVTGTAVLVSAANQLGIAVSSAKYKENIKDMGSASDNILKLKPKTFTYKDSSEIRYGLIAEEVAEIYPNLVVYDQNGDPQTVMYQELPSLLLNELKKALKRINVLEKKLEEK
jgi:hypothetical protein